jgi:hypothetical protein
MALIPRKIPAGIRASIRAFADHLSQSVKLKYKPIDEWEEFEIEVDTSEYVKKLKIRISELTGVESKDQHIFIRGKRLDDGADMEKLGLEKVRSIVMVRTSIDSEGKLDMHTMEKVPFVETISKVESSDGIQPSPFDIEFHTLKRLGYP